MRNKKLTYILIPIVALLWGYIFYKIFWGVKSTPNYAIEQKVKLDSLTSKQQKFEYKLSSNYPDPFLKEYAIRVDTVKKQEENITRMQRPASRRTRVQTTRWPDIKYGGIITNESSDKITILVEIDKQKCLMNVGEERKGVELKQYYKDSIVVKYMEELKTILK